MQQTFPASREPRVIIENISGDLSVRSWDQPSIGIETDGPISELHQEGDAQKLAQDRKSTRLNSSHANISYAVFCLKKKNTRRRSLACGGTQGEEQTKTQLI